MTSRLPQLITNAKCDGWYDWIVEPTGQLHPNTERALLEGCYFDADRAQQLQDFFVTFLTLPREPGELVTEYELESIHRRFPQYDPDKVATKKPFAMLKWWHRRVIGQLYGWRHSNGAKRYRRAFITTSKKSAKTTTLAGLPIAELLIGDVPEKEIYVVNATEDLAAYLFKKTHAMLTRSTRLKGLIKIKYATNTLYHPPTNSIFKTLPAVEGSIQGIQPNLLLLDELHAWHGRDVYDGLIYGDIRRTDSLRVIITTAGNDWNSVAFEEYEAAKELLDPNNDRYEQDAFAFIAEAGRHPVTGEDIPWEWDAEESFIHANPTLWENPQPINKLRQELQSAKNTPGKKRGWIRYMCNRYVSALAETWIDMEKWDECGSDIAA
jgi:phage terminase large subunit-like protein